MCTHCGTTASGTFNMKRHTQLKHPDKLPAYSQKCGDAVTNTENILEKSVVGVNENDSSSEYLTVIQEYTLKLQKNFEFF